jgi:GAF domain-containing protein
MSIEAFAKVTEASKLLVEQGFSETAVASAIEQVGRVLGVDRALVYENSISSVPGKRVAPLRHSWSTTALPQMARGFALQDQMAAWVEILSREQPVWELVRNLHGPLKAGLEAQGVQSVLLCPINVGTLNGRWWGILRLDDCGRERRWPADEVNVVKTLARSLSNALRQDMRREELERTRRDLRLLMNRCATGTS